MSRINHEEFIGAIFRLSREAPSSWGNFRQAFEAHVADMCETAVQSHVGDALVAHGRAQSLVMLRDEFRNIDATYEKLRQERERLRQKATQK